MSQTEPIVDRYVTFKGIDCEGNVSRLLAMFYRHIDDPERTNAFWEKVRIRLQKAGDEADPRVRSENFLLIIHSYINMFRELFETWDDTEALKLLAQIEGESC